MGVVVIHEDEKLIAVAKPAGQPVIAGRGLEGEPLNAEVARATGRRIYVVHRIDREAGGLVLFAKDAETHRVLCALFEARRISKVYWAAVSGRVERDGLVNKPLKIFGSGRIGVGKPGKPSLTRYKVLRLFPSASLLEVRPETGRRHQIRVHLYSSGHPLLGDPLYGQNRPVGGFRRLMLHALEMTLPEPFSLILRAEPDAGFRKILEQLLAGR